MRKKSPKRNHHQQNNEIALLMHDWSTIEIIKYTLLLLCDGVAEAWHCKHFVCRAVQCQVAFFVSWRKLAHLLYCNWMCFNYGSEYLTEYGLQLFQMYILIFCSIETRCFTFGFEKEHASSSKVHSISEKKVSLRAVRQFMRLGKSKQQSSRRDSSTEDENR